MLTIARTMSAPPEYGGPGCDGPEAVKPASPIASDPIALAIRTLREQGMPRGEIETVLEATETQVLRRYMELHRERLEERLAAELRALTEVERFLAMAILALTDLAASGRGEEGSPADRRRFT